MTTYQCFLLIHPLSSKRDIFTVVLVLLSIRNVTPGTTIPAIVKRQASHMDATRLKGFFTPRTRAPCRGDLPEQDVHQATSMMTTTRTLPPFKFRPYLLSRTLSRPYRHKTSSSEYGQPQTLLCGPLLLQHRQPSKVRAQLVFKTSSILWKVKMMPMLAVNAQVEPTPGAGALIPCGPPNKTNGESAVPA